VSVLPKVLIDCQVFPPPAFFAWMLEGRLLIETCEHYQKRSSRNRFWIRGAGRERCLSIPLCKGKNDHLPIREVCISYDHSWVRTMLSSLAAAYGRAPFYLFYKDELAELFHARQKYLFDFNCSTHQWLAAQLNIPYNVEYTMQYQHQPDEGILDLRGASLDWMDHSQQIENAERRYGELSSLHLLFHEGPEALGSILRWQTNYHNEYRNHRSA